MYKVMMCNHYFAQLCKVMIYVERSWDTLWANQWGSKWDLPTKEAHVPPTVKAIALGREQGEAF
jgi:hypothetical protein